MKKGFAVLLKVIILTVLFFIIFVSKQFWGWITLQLESRAFRFTAICFLQRCLELSHYPLAVVRLGPILPCPQLPTE